VDKDELTKWALKNGWQMIAGNPSLTKPSNPNEAIVRLILKGTVVNLEIKKPIGKWEKVLGVPYNKIEVDDETGMPRDLGAFDADAGEQIPHGVRQTGDPERCRLEPHRHNVRIMIIREE